MQPLPHLSPQWRRSRRSAPVAAVLLVHALLLLVWVSGVAPRLRGRAIVNATAPLTVQLMPSRPTQIEAPPPEQSVEKKKQAQKADAPIAITRTEADTPIALPAPIKPKTSTPIAAADPPDQAASTPQGLDLRLQGRPGTARRASAPDGNDSRALALQDPRSNSRLESPEYEPDTGVSQESLGDGRMKVRIGKACYIVHESHTAQLHPFNQSVSPTPRGAKPCS